MAAESPRGGNVGHEGDRGEARAVSRRGERRRETHIAATTGVGPVLGGPALPHRLGEGGEGGERDRLGVEGRGAARGGEARHQVRGGQGRLGGTEALRAGALGSVASSVPPGAQPGPGPLVAQTDQDHRVDYEEAGAGHQADQDEVGEREVVRLTGLLAAGHHHGLLAGRPLPHLLITLSLCWTRLTQTDPADPPCH